MKKTIIFSLLFVICASFLSAQNLSSLDNLSAPTKKLRKQKTAKNAIAATNKDIYVANVNECFSMLPLPNSRQYVMHFHRPLREFTQVMILDNSENMVSSELLFAGASDFYLNLNGLPKGKYEVRVMAEDEESYEFLVP